MLIKPLKSESIDKKVLVIEDTEPWCGLLTIRLRDLLKNGNYHIVGNEEEAIRLLEGNYYDLCIIAGKLPRSNGQNSEPLRLELMAKIIEKVGYKEKVFVFAHIGDAQEAQKFGHKLYIKDIKTQQNGIGGYYELIDAMYNLLGAER